MPGLVLLALLLLSGCGALHPRTFAPDLPFDARALIELIEWRYLGEDWWDAYDALDPAAKDLARNELLSSLVLLADVAYHRYEAAVLAGQATVDTAFDVAVLGLTSAATLGGGAALKGLLSAIATGLGGTQLALDRRLFAEQSAPALALRMRALRLQALQVLDAGMARPVEEYPLARGLSDVIGYVAAGTVSSALIAVAGDSAVTLQDAQRRRLEGLHGLPERLAPWAVPEETPTQHPPASVAPPPAVPARSAPALRSWHQW